MTRATEFLGLPTSYLAAAPASFVAPKNLEFVESRAAGKQLLDYGAATGGYSLALAKRGYTCTAIDVDPRLVEHARAEGVDAQLVRAGEPLPFEDGSFDTVILFETLEHVSDYRFALAEARRVTRANVLISVPNCTSTPALARASACFDHYLAEDHVNFFTRDELSEALRQIFARYEVIEDNYIEPALYKELLPFPFDYFAALLRRGRLLPRHLSYRLFAEAHR